LAVSLQTTLKRQTECAGVGLHTGQDVLMVLKPAPVDSGIVFDRVDLDLEDIRVEARFDSVGETMLGTSIANKSGASVATIEHLMAALSALGIDNLIVEIDGPELPIMDGSSAYFVELLDKAGVRSQSKTRRHIKILHPIVFADGEKRGELHPADGFTAEFEIDFDCPVIQKQKYTFDLSAEAFRDEIASARTFGNLKDVDQLRAAGLGRGASLDNTIVIDGEDIMNAGGLRFEDEFVRHKVLDAVGDLYLAGAPIVGHFIGIRAGHGVNNSLLRALFDNPDKWAYVEDTSSRLAPRDADIGRAWQAVTA
jgi:UDP-3-O-[3-hydroxymyristoyl] N-acetylglucosamine deacetylase